MTLMVSVSVPDNAVRSQAMCAIIDHFLSKKLSSHNAYENKSILFWGITLLFLRDRLAFHPGAEKVLLAA